MKMRSFSWQTLLICTLVFAVAFGGASTAVAQEQKADAAAKQLMAANGLFQRGLFKLAADNYQEFLTKFADHEDAPKARYGLAICHYRMGQYDQAASGLQELVKDPQFKQRDEALAVLGHCLLVTKQYDKALAAFDDLLDKHDKSKHAELAALNRAQVLYLLGKHKDSLSACRDFLKKYPSSERAATAEYFLACSQEALGEHADAEATLVKLLKDRKGSPHDLDATLLLGQCLENQDKLDPAAEQYAKFIEKAPKQRQAEGHYSLGLVLYKAGKYDQAIKNLSAVLSGDGKSQYAAPARLQLGLAQLAAGKYGDARKTLTAVTKTDEQRATKARYWLAQCDMSEGKHDSALAALEELAKLEPKPDNVDAILYDTAICTMELGKFEAAAGKFADFIKRFGESKQAVDALYRQAFCLHKLARYADSETLCAEIAKKPASNVTAPAAELSAENLFLLGKHGEAAKKFEELVKSAGDAGDNDRRLRYTFRLGQCAFLSGKYANAIKLLGPVAEQVAESQDENLREAIFFLGDAQLQTQRYGEASTTFEKYLGGKGTRRQEAIFKLGLSQMRGRQTAKAEKTLGEMINGPADSPWVMRAMFAYGQMAYHELHQPDKAAAVLGKLLSAKPPEDLIAPTMYLLGWIDFDAKKYEPAAERFAELVKRFGKHELAADAALQRAICVKEMGKTDDAIKLLRDFAKEHGKSERIAEARHLLGTCLAKAGQHAEAIKIFADLADRSKTRTEAVLYELAWSQRSNKQPDDAVKTYRKLLERFPNGKLAGAARTELAELLYLGKKYEDAALLAEKVIADTKIDPKTLAVAQYRLGWCYFEMSKHDKAAATFTTFVEKYPDHELTPTAMYQAGLSYMLSQNLTEAEKYFSQLLAKYGGHEVAPVTYLKLGEVQASAGLWAKSAETYKAFLEKHSDNKFAYLAQFGIGWAMENQQKYDDARNWYSQVTANHNGPTAAKAQFQIGECYFAQGQFDRAAGELLKVDIVYAYPEWSARALYEAGRAFEQLGRPEEARSQYELCVEKYKDSDTADLAKKRIEALENK